MVKYKKIPAMTPPVVHDYLREVGRAWKQQGVAVELGSWLGATAVPLLEGLVEAGYDRPFYAYDIWTANEEQVLKARKEGVSLTVGQNLLPLFADNVERVYLNNKYNRGYINATILKYPKKPIEICLFDAPKCNPTFENAVRGLHEYWIPGVTILGLLDYYFYKDRPLKDGRFLTPVKFMEKNKGCFTKLAEWPDQCSCVFFRYENKLKNV